MLELKLSGFTPESVACKAAKKKKKEVERGSKHSVCELDLDLGV